MYYIGIHLFFIYIINILQGKLKIYLQRNKDIHFFFKYKKCT